MCVKITPYGVKTLHMESLGELSLNKNFHKVEEIFLNCSKFPSILAFSETKLNDNSPIPNIEGYNFEYVNSSTSCGGVGIFISNLFTYNVRPDLSLNLNDCEDIWIELKSSIDKTVTSNNHENVIIGVVYRHPNRKYDLFSDKFSAALDKLNKTKHNYFICGDFNIDLMKYNIANNVTNYLNNIDLVGCTTFIDKPTRVTSRGGTCLDHVYSNFDVENLENYIVTADVSDHFGTYSIIKGVSFETTYPDIFFRKSDLSESEWEGFNSDLDLALKDISVTNNVNDLANSITQTYQNVIEKYMPRKKLSNKRRRKKNLDFFGY